MTRNDYHPDTVSPPTDTLVELVAEQGCLAVLRVPLRFWIARALRWVYSLTRKDKDHE